MSMQQISMVHALYMKQQCMGADIVKLLLASGNDAEDMPGDDAISVAGDVVDDFTPGAGADAGAAESM